MTCSPPPQLLDGRKFLIMLNCALPDMYLLFHFAASLAFLRAQFVSGDI